MRLAPRCPAVHPYYLPPYLPPPLSVSRLRQGGRGVQYGPATQTRFPQPRTYALLPTLAEYRMSRYGVTCAVAIKLYTQPSTAQRSKANQHTLLAQAQHARHAATDVALHGTRP